MKNLVLLILILISGPALGQMTHAWDSIINPTGTDTTEVLIWYTRNPAVLIFNCEHLGADDGTLEVGYAIPDSSIYVPFWIDRDLDGSNDLPVTLTAALKQYAIPMPFGFEGQYIYMKWTAGAATKNLTYFKVANPPRR